MYQKKCVYLHPKSTRVMSVRCEKSICRGLTLEIAQFPLIVDYDTDAFACLNMYLPSGFIHIASMDKVQKFHTIKVGQNL